jgi:hypothetical protein
MFFWQKIFTSWYSFFIYREAEVVLFYQRSGSRTKQSWRSDLGDSVSLAVLAVMIF